MSTTTDDYLVEPLPAHVALVSDTHCTPRTLLTIFLIFGLLMSAAIGVLLYSSFALARRQSESDKSVLVNRSVGFRNRAVLCEGQYVLGVRYDSDSPCMGKDVRAFWNPDHLTSFVSLLDDEKVPNAPPHAVTP